jgi:hypothetical protein
LFPALIALMAAATTACPAAPAPAVKAVDLTGPWQWEQGQESLDLTLEQHGNEITGYHSAVGQQGQKVDEVLEATGKPSITGEIKSNVATVHFRSGYPDSTGGGTARLTLRGAYLYWQIIKSDGEHYLPKSARLTRVKVRTPAKP